MVDGSKAAASTNQSVLFDTNDKGSTVYEGTDGAGAGFIRADVPGGAGGAASGGC
ncbi:hypothetical protein PI124_g17612 [Phytophthora idaei]|nr:hypothetical protein PI125_g15171 [Phytophthora idaei]KAG3137983.1 hypothetical protein PI126_g17119 [Phytophthora idaei]KAG3237393.1 hypothetical protein PI124_g17612 [Phytophthora idaei]